MTKAHSLTEHIQDWRGDDLSVDAEMRIVRNIALAGPQSRNGYRYSEEALRGAVSLYERKPVFLDHSQHVTRPWGRSTRDLVGSIQNSRYQNGRIRGDVHVLDTEAGRTFLALSKSNSPAIGMSHVVLAHRNSEGTLVEKIEDVVSVDAVMFPATTSTFREQQSSQQLPLSMEWLLQELDQQLQQWPRQHPNCGILHCKRVALYPGTVVCEAAGSSTWWELTWTLDDQVLTLGETLEPITPEEIASREWGMSHRPAEQLLKAERDALLQERDQLLRQLRTQQEVNELLQEIPLPDFARTELLMNQLQSATTRESRKALLLERKTLLEGIDHSHRRSRPPYSHSRIGETTTTDDDRFIAAIRRTR